MTTNRINNFRTTMDQSLRTPKNGFYDTPSAGRYQNKSDKKVVEFFGNYFKEISYHKSLLEKKLQLLPQQFTVFIFKEECFIVRKTAEEVLECTQSFYTGLLERKIEAHVKGYTRVSSPWDT